MASADVYKQRLCHFFSQTWGTWRYQSFTGPSRGEEDSLWRSKMTICHSIRQIVTYKFRHAEMAIFPFWAVTGINLGRQTVPAQARQGLIGADTEKI